MRIGFLPLIVVALTLVRSGAGQPAAPGAAAAPPAIFIEHARIIDGTGAPPREGQSILVEDGRIVSVLPDAQALAPPRARVLDVRGKTVLPGLIDTHVHLRDYVAELFLAHGVTTVRDAGNPTEWILALKQQWNAGRMRGPRLFVVGGILDPPPPLRGHHLAVESPDAARATTRRLLGQGVDGIKVYQRMTPELLRPIAEQAHAAGKRVIGHVTMSAGDAALAGIDALEHASGIARAIAADPVLVAAIPDQAGVFGFRFMDPDRADALARLLVSRHVTIVPALASWARGAARRPAFQAEAARVVSDPGLAYLTEEAKERVKTYGRRRGAAEQTAFEDDYRALKDFLARYRRAGGTLVVGTDGGALQGLSVHHEMQLLVDMGLTPMEAIQAATGRAAALIQAPVLGSIAPGQIADLVVLDADPLAAIANTKTISTVIQAGRIVDTRYHPDYRIPIPRPPVEGSRP